MEGFEIFFDSPEVGGGSLEDSFSAEPFELDIFDIKSDIVQLEKRLDMIGGLDPKIYDDVMRDLRTSDVRLDNFYTDYREGRISKEELETKIEEVRSVVERAEKRIDMYDSSRG